MKNNFLLQFFYKIFDKTKYKNKKNFMQINKDKIIFKKKYENYLNLIQENLYKKKEISSLHSGHTRDIINILPILKKLSILFSSNEVSLLYFIYSHNTHNKLSKKTSNTTQFDLIDTDK